MQFKSRWSATGELDFIVEGGIAPPKIIDIVAQNYHPAPVSVAGITPIIDIVAESGLHAVISHAGLDSLSSIVADNVIDKQVTSDDIEVDINVDRGIKSAVTSRNAQAIKRSNVISSYFEDSPALSSNIISLQRDAQSMQRSIDSLQQQLPKQQKNCIALQRDGDNVQSNIVQTNHRLADADRDLSSLFFKGTDCANDISSGYLYPSRSDCAKSACWQNTDALRHQVTNHFESGKAIVKQWLSHFEDAVNPTGQRQPIIIPPTIVPDHPITPLDFKFLWSNTGELDFLRIELDALIVMNEVIVNHVSSGSVKTALAPINATLDFDIDSFVYSLSGVLLGEECLNYLGTRAKFEIEVNGHKLNFVLREYSEATNFAHQAYSFTAVSSVQFLHKPHGELYTGNIESVTGMWQLIQSKLESTNFSLQRNTLTPEWNLAPDSFSYMNLSSIDLAQKAATAVGAILKPDILLDAIHVQPRYKFSPWNWKALTDAQCDHVIDANYITTTSSQDHQTPQLNTVMISGEYKGVVTNPVMDGTAGDSWADDVLSPLSQDHAVNNELARNIFSNSGLQEVIGLKFPVLPPGGDFGLLLPGDIVRIKFENKTVTGLCLNNNVPLQSIADIWQQPKIELNHGYS
ncbi:hypothetical protein CW745_13850 [Psychromonas sp. psych-6C06]|uniref:hypothetical protein n=1 Tax=Psychromonas sp. psych-6C06 TaxID=2058089 RepID=UPI000C329F95|nr:hypothetical protein [Psychromonas sp. psych-6C06]PKF60610.1 hypothetical protein CW745_13850 [Psychromonas sp. psych-6C06]